MEPEDSLPQVCLLIQVVFDSVQVLFDSVQVLFDSV